RQRGAVTGAELLGADAGDGNDHHQRGRVGSAELVIRRSGWRHPVASGTARFGAGNAASISAMSLVLNVRSPAAALARTCNSSLVLGMANAFACRVRNASVTWCGVAPWRDATASNACIPSLPRRGQEPNEV